jgi:radical SAM protein with 4Fe4S-binding SPASM domain
MDFRYLHDNEIYPLASDTRFLVYAPLAGSMFYLSQDEVERLEKWLAGENKDDAEAALLIESIRKESSDKRTIPMKREVSELHKLTILPTYQCNFKCSYCYSAQGRERKTLSYERAAAAIDYFIDRQRTALHDLWLAILGGGEPFMSPQLTGEIILKARERAREQGFSLGIGLTTNGSIYDKRLSEIMVANDVCLGVSFEVLKDIQEEQRQNYDKVVKVVRQYMDDGVDIMVKSIITPKNVSRLNEMVLQLHTLFPKVKKYKLQIVEDPVIFSDRGVMRHFYKQFSECFFNAQETGFQMGIDVYVLASKYVDMLVEHYCGGEMCLTPEGTITVCHRFSSPKEERYKDIVYGQVTEKGEVLFDDNKFRSLISHDITMQPKCRNCFAKWHCGGGCLAQSMIYADDQLDIICDWTRRFTQEILERQITAAKRQNTDGKN